jgi:hypothetical protein
MCRRRRGSLSIRTPRLPPEPSSAAGAKEGYEICSSGDVCVSVMEPLDIASGRFHRYVLSVGESAVPPGIDMTIGATGPDSSASIVRVRWGVLVIRMRSKEPPSDRRRSRAYGRVGSFPSFGIRGACGNEHRRRAASGRGEETVPPRRAECIAEGVPRSRKENDGESIVPETSSPRYRSDRVSSAIGASFTVGTTVGL